MPIPFITVVDQQGSRDICVIAGQPYYKSSGQNSGMEGIWCPFNGFERPVYGIIPLYTKPTATEDLDDQASKYFPDTVAIELDNWAEDMKKQELAREQTDISLSFSQNFEENAVSNRVYWGRFKDMKGLYTSCLLTKSNLISAPVIHSIKDMVNISQNKVITDHVGLEPNAGLCFDLQPISIITLPVNQSIKQDDITDLNGILTLMGMDPVAIEFISPELPNDYVQNTLLDGSSDGQTNYINPNKTVIQTVKDQIIERHLPIISSSAEIEQTNQSTISTGTWKKRLCCCLSPRKAKDKKSEQKTSEIGKTHNPLNDGPK